MLKFFAGFVTGVVATIVLLGLFVYFADGPALDIRVEMPASAVAGEGFQLLLILHNPHHEALTLENVALSNAVLEWCEVVAVTPAPDDDPVDLFVETTWYWDLEVPAGETVIVVFDLRVEEPGPHIVEGEVGSSSLEFLSFAKGIEIK